MLQHRPVANGGLKEFQYCYADVLALSGDIITSTNKLCIHAVYTLITSDS